MFKYSQASSGAMRLLPLCAFLVLTASLPPLAIASKLECEGHKIDDVCRRADDTYNFACDSAGGEPGCVLAEELCEEQCPFLECLLWGNPLECIQGCIPSEPPDVLSPEDNVRDCMHVFPITIPPRLPPVPPLP